MSNSSNKERLVLHGEWLRGPSLPDVIGRWNQMAHWWIERVRAHPYGDPFRRTMLTPTLLDQIGAPAGKRVLDLGCGEGYLSRLLAERGANVVGVDASSRLLKAARVAGLRQGAKGRVTYVLCSAERLEQLDLEPFDIVIANMLLMDVPDHQAVIDQAHAVLQPGGQALWSILHPATFKETGEWLLDPPSECPTTVSRGSFRASWARLIRIDPDAPVRTAYFHRCNREYGRAFRAAGLTIETILEPSAPRDLAAEWPRTLEEFAAKSPVLVFNTVLAPDASRVSPNRTR